MVERHDDQEYERTKQDVENAYTVGTVIPRIRVRLENWSRERNRLSRDELTQQRRAVLPWIYRASNFPDTEINQRVGTACLITLVDYLHEAFEIKVRGERLFFFEVLLTPRRQERPLSLRVEERFREVFSAMLTRTRLPPPSGPFLAGVGACRLRNETDHAASAPHKKADFALLARLTCRKEWVRHRLSRFQELLISSTCIYPRRQVLGANSSRTSENCRVGDIPDVEDFPSCAKGRGGIVECASVSTRLRVGWQRRQERQNRCWCYSWRSGMSGVRTTC